MITAAEYHGRMQRLQEAVGQRELDAFLVAAEDSIYIPVDGSYRRLLSQLAKTDLLVLDDWGLAPLTDTQGRGLLEVIDDRSQTRSTVVASQLPQDHWHAAMVDPTVADAILDRLVHGAHQITLKGESMRKIKNPS